MWVVKKPKRFDFCGQPPCGLCFDWTEPMPPVEFREVRGGELVVEKTEPYEKTIDGMQKMTEDIMGVGVTPTPEQRKQIQQAAELIHLHNLNKSKVTPEQAHKDTIEEVYTARAVNAFLNQKAKEKAAEATKPKRDLRPTLDEIADKKEVPKNEEKEEISYKPSREARRNAFLKREAEMARLKEEYMAGRTKY